MFRLLGAAVLVLALAGCATPTGPHWWRQLAGLPATPGHFRFDWQIDGDPSLAPLQVFDDGQRTWLQYPAGQLVPALFERTSTGDRLLHPQREGDYLVLSGVPARLVVRGGHLQAQIWRDGAGDTGGTELQMDSAGAISAATAGHAGPLPVRDVVAPAVTAASVVPPVLASSPVSNPPALASVSGTSPHSPAALPAPPPAPPPLPAPPAHPAPPTFAVQPAASAAVTPARSVRPAGRPVLQSFEATPADGNIRRALGRWARSAGWVFEAEHWAVDVDIPLAGSAAFGDEFVPAVRGLLAATELGDRPLQPCFYANQVLRVVPLAQRCDRTQVAGASS